MILMNKVEITAYRYLGCAGSCFTLFQSVIWLLLTFIGLICKYLSCGSTGSKRTFKYCFYLMYYYQPINATSNFTRVNYIGPSIFQGIMGFSMLLCIGNILISVLTAKAFIEWKDPKKIKRMAYFWTRCILAISVCELIMFIIFASDVVSIKQKEDVKCFLKLNLSLLKSHSSERAPAPYLLQLKSNLKAMKKKIRTYKKNLLFLDAVFDEKSPDHIENPFISKDVVNNYVEDIWKSMFNSSIREKVRRTADTMPLDESMRNFVMSEHLDLDDMDFDLLKNFDGLTNNKWIKPIHSSNVVFGRQFNLTSSLASDDSAELDKITSLLHEYLKENDISTTTANYSSPPEQSFDFLFNDILDELEEKETHFIQNQDELNSILEKIDLLYQNDSLEAMDNEEVLLTMKKFFDDMVPQDEGEQDGKEQDGKENDEKEQDLKEIDEANIQRVINKIKEFLENNETEESDYGNIIDPMDYVYDNDDFDQLADTTKKFISYTGNSSFPDIVEPNEGKEKKKEKKRRRKNKDFELRAPKPAPKKTTKKGVTVKTTPKPKETYANELVKELCENCVYFILGPSIVCMILSLKTGLVWLLNIIVAVLVLYYGTKVQLKLKFQFFKSLLCKKK